MNTQNLRFLAGAIFALAALSLDPMAIGRTDASFPAAASSTHLRVASKNDLKWSADKLDGDKLTARDGKKLGSIKDFLLEADSGRVRYAIVATGGFVGVGDKLHLVPYYMLSQSGDDRGFTASITPDLLNRAPAINEETFEENRVGVDAQQQRQIIDAFSSSGANVKSDRSAPGRLVRATKLDGRDVMANGATLGSIDAVVITPGATHALAVFKPEHPVTNDDEKFLVPISRLKIEVGQGAAITTTLSQSDFQAAEQADRSNDQALTPTGRTSAEQNLGAPPAVVSAAHSIRQALDADSSLAQAEIQVTPEQGRVLVQGTVVSDGQKAAVEHAADQAANGANIDFELTVHEQ